MIHLTLPTLNRRRIAIGVVVLLVAAAGGAWLLHRSRAMPEGAVMRWGDTVITEAQLDRRISVLEAVYGVTAPTGADKEATFRRDAAKSMAVSTLLEQEAERRDISISRKTATDQLSTMISDDLGGDRDRFIDFLADHGIRERDVIDEIIRVGATRELYEQVTEDVDKVTTADALKEFEERKDDMVSPERRQLRNIVVASESDADRVLARLRGGEAFDVVARESSLDSSTSKDGGLLGELVKDELEKPVAKAAFEAAEGTVYGPAKGQYGWNVGHVDEIIAPKPLQFDEVSDLLVRQLQTERTLRVWGPWLGKLQKNAEIEYADEYRPKDPDSIPDELKVPAEE